jgi:hypothetical protein
LPEEHQTVVTETLETGEVVEPPPPPAPKPKKSRKKVEDDDSEAEPPKPKRKSRAKAKSKKVEDTDDSEGALEAEAKPKPNAQRKGKKRPSDEMDDSSEPEYVPKKTRSRAKPMEEEVDPAVTRIQAMAEELRMKAAK